MRFLRTSNNFERWFLLQRPNPSKIADRVLRNAHFPAAQNMPVALHWESYDDSHFP